jgi:hypothetical protein
MDTIAPSARDAPHAFGVTVGRGAANAAEVALLERTRQYLAAIERSTDSEARAEDAPSDGALSFYHLAVRQEELPNRFLPSGDDCFEPF